MSRPLVHTRATVRATRENRARGPRGAGCLLDFLRLDLAEDVVGKLLLSSKETTLTGGKSSLHSQLHLQQFDGTDKISKLKQLVSPRLNGLRKLKWYVLAAFEDAMEQIRYLPLAAIIVYFYVVESIEEFDTPIDKRRKLIAQLLENSIYRICEMLIDYQTMVTEINLSCKAHHA